MLSDDQLEQKMLDEWEHFKNEQLRKYKIIPNLKEYLQQIQNIVWQYIRDHDKDHLIKLKHIINDFHSFIYKRLSNSEFEQIEINKFRGLPLHTGLSTTLFALLPQFYNDYKKGIDYAHAINEIRRLAWGFLRKRKRYPELEERTNNSIIKKARKYCATYCEFTFKEYYKKYFDEQKVKDDNKSFLNKLRHPVKKI